MSGEFNREFQEQLPRKPYCSNELAFGVKVRSRPVALAHKYIQLNSPWVKWCLVFDLDYPATSYAAYDVDLPWPTFYVHNWRNSHAHLIYALTNPVYTCDNARLKPLRYAAAIEAAYIRRLGADPGYAGLIAKNPWRDDFWSVFAYNGLSYELEELACHVEGELKPLPRRAKETWGLGRNCTLFEKVSAWAYRAVRRYWEPGRVGGGWDTAVLEKCAELNGEFPSPLPSGEVSCTARSVARWVWRRFTPGGLSEWQRRQIGRRWAVESKRGEGLELLRGGLTAEEVSEACGASLRSVRRWRQEAGMREPTTTEKEPWAALGMSRATWYRKRAREAGLS